jgi:hypothetical protein
VHSALLGQLTVAVPRLAESRNPRPRDVRGVGDALVERENLSVTVELQVVPSVDPMEHGDDRFPVAPEDRAAKPAPHLERHGRRVCNSRAAAGEGPQRRRLLPVLLAAVRAVPPAGSGGVLVVPGSVVAWSS